MKLSNVIKSRPDPDGQPGSIDFDIVLEAIGANNRFQWKQLALFYCVGMASGLAILGFSFTGR